MMGHIARDTLPPAAGRTMATQTLAELFDDFLSDLSGQSAASQRNYRHRLAVFLESYGDMTPGEVQRRHVNEWHAALVARKLAGPTLAGYRQAVRAYFNWLVAEGYLARNPTAHLRIGSYIPSRPKLPAESDVECITNMVNGWLEARRSARLALSQAPATGRHSAALHQLAYPDPACVRDAAIWLVARGCGPRSGELCNWRLSDLRRALDRGPDAAGVYVSASRGKTGATLIRFDARTAEALRNWLAARPAAECDYVFVTTRHYRTRDGRYRPLTRAALGHVFESLAHEAGASSIVRSHALRHRVGHLVTKQHGPKVAALLLNHKDADTAATAIAFYHHPDEADISRAVASLGER